MDRAASQILRLSYYEHVAKPPQPAIVVIQDLDPEPGFGAFWGEVNTAIHKGLGLLGCITNGSIRDLDVIAPEFQLLAGMVAPSHAWVRVETLGDEVTVHGMAVRDGDLIHADRHGAVVIPHEAAPQAPGRDRAADAPRGRHPARGAEPGLHGREAQGRDRGGGGDPLSGAPAAVARLDRATKLAGRDSSLLPWPPDQVGGRRQSGP